LLASGGNVDAGALADSDAAKHNWLAWTMAYMLSRVQNCTDYCVICDRQLEGSGVKPVVCDKEMCVWRHEELGLGVQVVNEFAVDASVVDLMISMCVASVSSSRNDLVFQPFPSDYLKNGRKDWNTLKADLNQMPSLNLLVNHTQDEQSLASYLNGINPRLYRLLRWILSSNRCFLKKLNTPVTQMSTQFQYILQSAPPEKSQKFNAYRAHYGSFYAFHGSSLENWHAIMRTGLKNLSNTKLMTTGAVYGAGIYLSPHASTSKDYVRGGQSWAKSQFGSGQIACIAICEVIQHPCLAGQPNPHYVVPDGDLVITRFFFLYGSVSQIPTKVDLTQLKPFLYKLQGYSGSG